MNSNDFSYQLGLPTEAATRQRSLLSPEVTPPRRQSADGTMPRIPFGTGSVRPPGLPLSNIIVNINGTTNINNFQQ